MPEVRGVSMRGGTMPLHTYAFMFRCEKCGKELTELRTSPDVLTKEELSQVEFHLKCKNAGCNWTAEQTGFGAEKIKAALKPVSVCW
jgi:hypothetical protein